MKRKLVFSHLPTAVFLLFVSLLSLPKDLFSQNVGIANISPTEKFSINGNLLVAASYTKSNNTPDGAHTSSIVSGSTTVAVTIVDSAYRILDPGGNGNYLPNIPYSAITVIDTAGLSAGALTGGLELTFEMINVGTGDSVFLVDGSSSTILLRAGSNLNAATPLTYTGNNLVIFFLSNGDASVGAGFSAIVRKLYPEPATNPAYGTRNYGNSALFYNAQNGSLKAGIGNSNNGGFGSITLGAYNYATGPYSIAIGYGSKATLAYGAALAGGNAYGISSIAIGPFSVANATHSQSFGYQARADGTMSSALTPYSSAYGDNSTAIGNLSKSFGSSSVALTGGITDLAGYYTTAIGFNAIASNNYSVAIGKSSNTTGSSAIAIGEGSRANADYGLAIGYNALTNGYGSVSIGASNAGGNNAIAIGTAYSSGTNTTAIGQGTDASGSGTVSIGYFAHATGTRTVALGTSVSASGTSSFATGFNTTADGNYSTAMGNYVSTSSFDGAFTIGDNSTTTVMGTFVANGFRARFASGYRLFTNSAVTVGAFLNANANAWATLSDVRLKENFIPVDGEGILKKISGMPQFTWNYKGQDVKTLRHYGPMAQDFYKAFGKDDLGEIGCDTLINQHDFLGVSLIAIQALEKRTQKIDQLLIANEELKKQNQALEKRLEVLEAIINRKSLVNQQ